MMYYLIDSLPEKYNQEEVTAMLRAIVRGMTEMIDR